jgi:uncharacterized protein (DUF885 family)
MRGFLLAVVLVVGLAGGREITAQAAGGSAGAQSAALAVLFKDMWDDQMQRNPEVASMLGDRRYNDQVKDLSASAFNDEVAKDRQFLMRMAMIDTTALSAHEKQMAEVMEQELFEAEDGAKFKEWEMPVNRRSDIEADLAANVSKFPFASVKDYDDYIARLKKYPDELRQAIGNMQVGIDDGRLQPVDVIEKALKQAEEIAAEKPEESVFAAPLKRFPATVASVADRKRISEDMLDAIQNEVLPAYARFASFLKAQEIPAAQKDGGAWAAKEGDAFYTFCVKRDATWEKMVELKAH